MTTNVTIAANSITLWDVPHPATGHTSTVWSMTRMGAMKKANELNGKRWGKPGIPTKA